MLCVFLCACRYSGEVAGGNNNALDRKFEKQMRGWREIQPVSSKDDESRFSQPRAVGISDVGNFYTIDRSGKIFVFDKNAAYKFSFALPDFDKGTPTGIGFNKENNILIPDTHYSRILVFSPDGKELNRFGSYGTNKGNLIYPTDITVDKDNNYYISDYGGDDRICKYDKEGKFLKQWGRRGDGNGEMYRPMSLEFNSREELVVADSCNHRIVCFTKDGEFIRSFGKLGSGAGELKYPYDLAVDKDDDVYIIEYGNCRISKFSRDGKFIGFAGVPGYAKGAFHSPWGICIYNDKTIAIADTLNHRVILADKF